MNDRKRDAIDVEMELELVRIPAFGPECRRLHGITFVVPQIHDSQDADGPLGSHPNDQF